MWERTENVGKKRARSVENCGGRGQNHWEGKRTRGKGHKLVVRDWNCGEETGTSGMEAQMRGREEGIGQEHMIGRLVLLESFRHLKAVFVQDIFLRI